MILGVSIFGIVALAGLLAAKRPDIYVKYFLADWQRERIPNPDVLRSTGWMIFGFCGFTAVLIVIANTVGR